MNLWDPDPLLPPNRSDRMRAWKAYATRMRWKGVAPREMSDAAYHHREIARRPQHGAGSDWDA